MKIQSVPCLPHVFFVGPSLEVGPLPALFYFALSAKDSLTLDPFNQPVKFLEKESLRIFSLTLPAHENDIPPESALTLWEEQMKQGEQVIPPFIQQVKKAIDFLKPFIYEGKCFTAGLSRGAFIACHVAAICPEISHILGFAPLTRFRFEEGEKLNLIHLTPKLFNRSVRFYIGNHDTRVGTEHAFNFIFALADQAQQHRIRGAPIELIIGPSIGYKGHGTPPNVFKDGANWLKEELKK